MNDCSYISDNSCNSDCNYIAVSSDNRNSEGNRDTKELKFGIDKILQNDGKRGREPNISSSSKYCTSTANCCQVNHMYAQFYPHLYISTNSFLPVVRKYANFVIEGDRSTSDGGTSKRKRIWSRAVFSKLQRKGLEKRFQVQKYIMKPDRKQLAATLGLTDAQVKVWFQNRRMKWRNSRENDAKDAEKDAKSEQIQT